MVEHFFAYLLRPKVFGLITTGILLLLGVGLWPERHADKDHFLVKPQGVRETGVLAPLSLPKTQNSELADLGAKLFVDKRLSRDQTISCESCHSLTRGGVDGLPNSTGINGQMGKLNAPTVFNASLNFKQFWDGRANTLEEQAKGPVENPIEMGFSWPEAVERLRSDQYYKLQFKKHFSDGLTAKNIRLAIAAFEETLTTPGSAFDRYLQGDTSALNKKAKAGYQLFLDFGCVACHQGQNIGGTMYEKLGIVKPYYGRERQPKPEDLGRYNLTQDDEHKYEFKVPSLRNVAKTGPYFHDGSIATLEEAVRLMGRHQLGIEFSSEEIVQLVEFLNSLTGHYNGKSL
jgi:cytochrome c peroxidase